MIETNNYKMLIKYLEEAINFLEKSYSLSMRYESPRMQNISGEIRLVRDLASQVMEPLTLRMPHL